MLSSVGNAFKYLGGKFRDLYNSFKKMFGSAFKFPRLNFKGFARGFMNGVNKIKSHVANLVNRIRGGGKKCTWSSRKNGIYIQEQHGKTNECYNFATAKLKCQAAGDCHAIATQSNVCGGKYRVTHGGPTEKKYGNWKAYNLWSYTLTCNDARSCKDGKRYAPYCQKWKKRGYCANSKFRKNVWQWCAKTCSKCSVSIAEDEALEKDLDLEELMLGGVKTKANEDQAPDENLETTGWICR